MAVPPPLDPVLLREHAYQDTKLIRLVLSPDLTPGFLPLHLRGLGRFTYELEEKFSGAFSARGIDINNKDPNVDTFSEDNNNDHDGTSFSEAVFSLIILAAGLYLITKVARRLWTWSLVSSKSVPASTKIKNIKELHLSNKDSNSNTFDQSEALEKGFLNNEVSAQQEELKAVISSLQSNGFHASRHQDHHLQQIYGSHEDEFTLPITVTNSGDDDNVSTVPSLVNTPVAAHQRNISVDTMIQTPASTTDFYFDRIQNSSSRASTANSSSGSSSDNESEKRHLMVKGLGIDNVAFDVRQSHHQFYA